MKLRSRLTYTTESHLQDALLQVFLLFLTPLVLAVVDLDSNESIDDRRVEFGMGLDVTVLRE